jgi:hypothetical protein
MKYAIISIMECVFEQFKSLFWDSSVDKIDIKTHKKYIIERILEYGDTGPVKWMFETYPLKEVKKVLKESRALSKKSSDFWRSVLKGAPVKPAQKKIS